MDQPTQPSNELLQAIEKLPILVPDADADTRYGAGEREGEAWRQGVADLADQAEDSKSEIESSFEVPLRQTEDDFEMLDMLIANGWAGTLPPEEELAAISLGWGSYAGDVVLQSLGGSWVVRQDAEHASIRFPRVGLQFFPVHAILRRFALGDQASLDVTYQHLVDTLVD
ncbi:MAG TPA: hypothetical protein V6D05_00500 [Stenomitos sp.]